MCKMTGKFFVALLIVVFALFVDISLASAHVSKTYSTNGCAHLMVYLHGNNLATSHCLDTTQSSHGVIPYTNQGDCSGNSLHLYYSTNFNGNLGDICFLGTGFINLTDYSGPWYLPFNWNDNAASYRTGCNTGTFYTDINGNGARQPFYAGEANNFTNNPIQEDTLSSFTITSSC